MSEIRVLIADDHAVLRTGLKLLIGTQSDLTVVGESGDVDSTRQLVHQLQPDVVTLDLSMPGGAIGALIEELTRDSPVTRLLVLTMHDDPSMLRMAMAAGAAGYIVKSAADTELLDAIRAVAAGRTFVSLPGKAVPVQPVGRLPGDDDDRDALKSLSTREAEVLRLVAQGFTNQSIADRLFLSVKTVESYRSRLMAKLQLKTRADLTQLALRAGLLSSDKPENP